MRELYNIRTEQTRMNNINEQTLSTPMSFSNTGHSNFLENILDPTTEPSSIPDEILSRHVLKQDTISGTLSPTTQLMFVTNLSRPDSLLGNIYTINGTTVALSTNITTSQVYSLDFTDIRHISCDLNIVNNTVSTTNFTVAGTANCITYQGKLHELLKYNSTGNPVTIPTYSQLAGLISSAMDKAVSVALSGGVKVLALPDSFDVPYYRITNSSVPLTVGATLTLYNSTSSDYDDIYSTTFSYSGAVNTTASVIMPFTAFNTFVSTELESTAPTASTRYQIEYLGLDGNAITTQIVNAPGTAGFSYTDLLQPTTSYVVAIRLTVSNTTNPITENNTRIMVRVSNGNLPGFLQPTNIIMTNGLPSGANIVWSGTKNTELKPNNALARNVPTKYPYYDPKEMDYTRLILAHRDKLRIRTVMPILLYEEAIRVWKEYSYVNKSETIRAEALDIWPLINTIRKIAVPFASALFPSAAPVISAIDSGLSAIIPSSDSTLTPSRGAGLESMAYSSIPMGYKAHAADSEDGYEVVDDINESDVDLHNMMLKLLDNWEHASPDAPTQSLLIGPNQANKVATLFPVILTSCSGSNPKSRGCMLYAVLNGKQLNLLRPSAAKVVGHSANGKCIYGYNGFYPSHLDSDKTLVPISGYRSDTLLVMGSAPVVSGSSCLAAIYVADKTNKVGVFRSPITGSIRDLGGRIVPVPNLYYNTKNKYVTKYCGTPLVQSDINAADRSTVDGSMERLIERAYGKSDNNWPSATPPPCHPDPNLYSAKAASTWPIDLPVYRGVPSTDAFNLGAMLQNTHPGLQHLAYVFEWIVENDVVPELYKLTQADPSGQLFRARWSAVVTGGKGPSARQAQEDKWNRLYNDLSRQYSGITLQWIEENGGKGPSAEQAKYYSATGLLPPPGTNPPALVPQTVAVATNYGPPPEGKELLTLAKNYKAKIESRIKNDSSLTEDMKSALNNFGDRYKRAPSTTEYNGIKLAHAGSMPTKSKGSGRAAGGVMRVAPATNTTAAAGLANPAYQGNGDLIFEYTQPPGDLV